ncbi:MAG: NAD(P)/FAD-dependent oxidoreductase, partial [candidate division Zixibacteria bacterium]|nr:NAD(P)/FAD-dependent oxidoreductase [candidate division Zixibacteria bacterium]
MSKSYDIVVVGAGPTGSTAARFAAEGGANVLLIDRKRDIGIPVRCGEGVSKEPLKEFIEPHPSFVRNSVDQIRLFPPNGNSVVLTPDKSGYILDRRVFDRELSLIAANSGADLLTSCAACQIKRVDDSTVNVFVSHHGDKKVINCKIVIGADGVESRVGRMLGIETATTLHNTEGALQYVISHPEINTQYCDFYFGNNVAPGGYLWVFPGENNIASIGLGCAGDELIHKSLHQLLDNFMNKTYPGAKILSEVAGGIPVQATLEEITADNILLCGDAARQVSPITGGGIINGMVGGKLAGITAAHAIENGSWKKSDFEEYPKEWHNRIGENHNKYYKMK